MVGCDKRLSNHKSEKESFFTSLVDTVVGVAVVVVVVDTVVGVGHS